MGENSKKNERMKNWNIPEEMAGMMAPRFVAGPPAVDEHRTGYAVVLEEPDQGYVPSKWEERFAMCQLDAILHMLHHLTRGLPVFARRWFLKRASKFPRLHGHFAPLHADLGFHASECDEAFGMSSSWVVMADGTHKQRW